MILSDAEILSEVRAGRLVFDPELSENDNRLQSASVDLHLRNVFWRPQGLSKPGIHVTVDVSEASAYDYFDREDADELQLQPGEFVLGETHEAIGIPLASGGPGTLIPVERQSLGCPQEWGCVRPELFAGQGVRAESRVPAYAGRSLANWSR